MRARALHAPAIATFGLALAGCPKSTPTTAPAEDAAPAASASAAPADPAPRVLSGNDAGMGELMNAAQVPEDELRKALNPQNLPPYTGATGSVEGTVWVEGPSAPDVTVDASRCAGAKEIYGKAFREGAASPDGKGRALADTVVAVTGYAGFFVPEKDEAQLVRIEGCGFDARTVTMTFGQRLEVLNTTDTFWSPKIDPAPNPVFMMAPPHGKEPVRLYPKRFGLARLLDHDRAFAQADLYVFLHPLHTVTSRAGRYRIDGVPVGKVKVNARHPAIDDETTKEIEVQASVVHQVDLVLRHAPKDAGPPVDAGRYYPVLR